MTCTCKLINAPPSLAPGWGCCACRTYNGMQRKRCYRCGHEPPAFDVPASWIVCPVCGGALHKGGPSPLATMEGRPIGERRCPVEGCGALMPQEAS